MKKEKMNFFWKKWLKDLFSQFEQKKNGDFLIFDFCWDKR